MPLESSLWIPNSGPSIAACGVWRGVLWQAHKTACKGTGAKLFQHALQDDRDRGGGVPIAHRLFMTATPRHFRLRQGGAGRKGNSSTGFRPPDSTSG